MDIRLNTRVIEVVLIFEIRMFSFIILQNLIYVQYSFINLVDIQIVNEIEFCLVKTGFM